MSEKMLVFTSSLFDDLVQAIVAQSASEANRYRAAPFFGLWFQSPLAYNDYTSMLQDPAPPQPLQTMHCALNAKKRPIKEEEDSKAGLLNSAAANTGKRRIHMIELSDIVKQAQPNNTTIEVVRNKGTLQPMRAVTTVAYDGRTQIGIDSLASVYGADQNVAVETLKDNMERRFASHSQIGVVAKISQTLLVLALEPADISLDFLVQHRVDNNIVVSNLLDIAEEQRTGRRPPPPQEEIDEDENAQMRDFRSKVKRITVNLFSRFPELAIDCTETPDPALIKTVFSLWVASGSLFDDTRTSLQGESARALRAPYKSVLERVLGDRTELLCATVISNIEGSGLSRWFLFRELFVTAILRAHLHVDALAEQRPSHVGFQRAKRALKATYERVHCYQHSALILRKQRPSAVGVLAALGL